jgi:hypothetical protein
LTADGGELPERLGQQTAAIILEWLEQAFLERLQQAAPAE